MANSHDINEPVAVVEITYGREPECYVTGNIDDFPEGVFKLYAAPVQQAEQEPGEWINEDELPEFYPYDDMYQSSKVINGVRMFPNVKVSDRSMFYALTKDHTWISVTETQFNKLKPECRMKCYIAPVRTKDLTGQDLCDLEIAVGWKGDSHEFELLLAPLIKSVATNERERCADLRKEVPMAGVQNKDYEQGFWDALALYEGLIRSRK